MSATEGSIGVLPFADLEIPHPSGAGADWFAEHFSRTEVTVIYLVCGVLGLLVGPPLYLGVILYESRGEDPLKRTLANRLTSSTCFFCCALSTLNLVNMYRAAIGPVSHPVAVLFMIGGRATYIIVLFLVCEILVYKCVCLKRKVALIKHEDFWFFYLNLLNVVFAAAVIGFYLTLMRPDTAYARLTGRLFEDSLTRRSHGSRVTSMTVAMAGLIYTFSCAYFLVNMRYLERVQPPQPEVSIPTGSATDAYNTSPTNATLQKLGQILLNVALVVTTSIPQMVMGYWGGTGKELLTLPRVMFYLADLYPAVITNMVLPMIYYYNHPRIGTYIWKNSKEHLAQLFGCTSN